MKLNEPGRQELSRYRSPVRKHSIQSYILTYYKLRKREPLVAPGSHQEEPLLSASAVPHRMVLVVAVVCCSGCHLIAGFYLLSGYSAQYCLFVSLLNV